MQAHTAAAPRAALLDPKSAEGRALELALQAVCHAIDSAADLPALEAAARQVRDLVRRLIGEAPAVSLTGLISALNDTLTRRVIDVMCSDVMCSDVVSGDVVSADVAVGAPHSPHAVNWCWIAFGSEGRQEQTLSSDQDNGIVFASEAAAQDVRDVLLPLAHRINDALSMCGFPLCRGQVMASNPRCCLSLQEWKLQFMNWIAEGNPQSLLNATIFFDLRALHGTFDLAEALTDWLAHNAADNPRFLLQLSANALQRRPPLGLLRDFVIEKSGEFIGTLDLKTNAATLFIDAGRIYGLSCGARAAGTAERLRRAAQAGRFASEQAERWIEAFYCIQMLRLEHQKRQWSANEAMNNHVDPRRLDGGQRRLLLGALRQARTLQNALARDYPGSA